MHAIPHTLLLVLGTGAPAAPVGEAPQVEILFPTGSALTEEAVLHVRGSARDPDGVLGVFVDGVPAHSTDGFATWEARVPLEVGHNELVVEAVDALGQSDPAAATANVVRRSARLGVPTGLAFDPARGECLVLQYLSPPRVLAIDAVSGVERVLSDAQHGSGVPLGSPTAVAVDALRDRAIVTESLPRSLIAIDLASGDRTVLSSATQGWGPNLGVPLDVALLPGGNQALVTTNVNLEVFLIDLTTGERTIVSSGQVGSGVDPGGLMGIAWDEASQRAVLSDAKEDRLLWLDPVTGKRTILSGAGFGAGPLFDWPEGLELDPQGGVVWVASRFGDSRVMRVNLATGDRLVASGPSLHGGVEGRLIDVAVDPFNGRVFALDEAHCALTVMKPAVGRLERLHAGWIGAGPALSKPTSVAADPIQLGDVLVLSSDSSEVHAVDTDSGQRELVSGATLGAGPELDYPRDLSAHVGVLGGDPIVFAANGLLRVDRATGNRSTLSSTQVGSGPNFEWVVAMTVDPTGARALVLEEFSFADNCGRLLEVDLATGDRTILAMDNLGAGPSLTQSRTLALAPGGLVAWVVSRSPNQVLRVDLITGDRTVVSGPSLGRGPELQYPGPLLDDSAQGRLLLTDQGRLLAIDLASGDRSVLTRAWIAAGGLAPRWLPGGGFDQVLFTDGYQDRVGAVDLITRQSVSVSR